MILPQTYIGTLIVMILGLLCAGLWANTFKIAGKLRFEVYYFDFAIGLGIAGVVFAFTLGNLGYDGFSVMDDLMQAHKRQWLEAFGGGVIFNLANMLLVAAISIAGMAVPIQVALGLTLVAGILLSQMGHKSSNPLFSYLGCALILASVVASALAHKYVVAAHRAAMATQGKSARRPIGVAKALILATVSGLLMVAVYPLLNMARGGDSPLGPYSLTLLLTAGAFLSTLVFNLFFMNLPVQGQPLELGDYFKMQVKRHRDGVLGGLVWCSGIVLFLVGSATAPEAQLTHPASFAFANGSVLIAGLCGLVFWKEFAEGGGSAKGAASAALILFAGGLALVALSLG